MKDKLKEDYRIEYEEKGVEEKFLKPKKQSKFKRFFKKPKFYFILVVIILLTGIAFGTVFGLKFGKGSETQIISKTAELSFKDIGRLETQEAYITIIECMTNDRKFFGTDVKIPFTDTLCIFSLDFQVIASYNFENIVPEITEPVGDGQKGVIKVTLPEAELNTSTKSASEEVYYDKESIFSNIPEEEKAKARAEMEAKAEKEAVDNGILSKARSNAEKILTNFIYSLRDKEKYEIVFENQ